MNAGIFLRAAITVTLAAALFPATASASTAPAITAFDDAFAKVHDYTVMMRAHEVLGTQTQDRVYQYWFLKPSYAKTAIVSGPGAGGGGVWNGGDQVSGHQGGMLSFIHLKVGLHDPRAVSLRGYTIPEGLFPEEVDKYAKIPGKLTQVAGPKVDGQPTDVLILEPKDPAANGGVTKFMLFLSQTTHFPVRQIRFEGAADVADETWYGLKTNIGLTPSDFPF